MGTWNYTYDAVDRLTTATPGSGAPSKYAGQYGCWTYDSYGNRTLEAFSIVPCTGTNPTPQILAVYNPANNRIQSVSGTTFGTFTYDASGNTAYDGRNSYWYDAEGQLCAVQSPSAGLIQYVYDAEGARIAKANLAQAPAPGASCTPYNPTAVVPGTNTPLFALQTRWLVDLGGDQVTELSETGSESWTHSNVWAGGKLVATYDAKGIHYELTDPLGTKRVQANALGQVDETCTGLPFGNDLGNQSSFVPSSCGLTTAQQQANTLQTNDDATEHHFTGKERDAESGNDYFGARYYASAMGRFLSPDWASNPQAVPYGIYTNPQTLNLYNYMRNNPLSGIDKDGHCGGPNDPCAKITVEVKKTQDPILTTSSDGKTSTAKVEGKVMYTVKNDGKPMEHTQIHEDVSTKTTRDGKPEPTTPVNADGPTNNEGKIGDVSSYGKTTTAAPSVPGANAAEEMIKGSVITKETTQTLTIGGTGCQVTEMRTLSITNGVGTLTLQSPEIQTATPTPTPPQ